MKNEFEKISISPNTVPERITEMSRDVENALMKRCRDFEAISLAIDESIGIADNAKCVTFISGAKKNLSVTEELLDLVPMKGAHHYRSGHDFGA